MTAAGRPPSHFKKIGRYDEWETPPDIFRKACEISGITPVVDVSATRHNAKCSLFLDRGVDGLRATWPAGPVWCNPPYSNVAAWMGRIYDHWMDGGSALCLTYNKTDTAWFHRYVWPYARIWWWPRRIQFMKNGVEQGQAPYPSMLFAFYGRTGTGPQNQSQESGVADFHRIAGHKSGKPRGSGDVSVETGGKSLRQMCPNCGHVMVSLQSCHQVCPNCGGHVDCSD